MRCSWKLNGMIAVSDCCVVVVVVVVLIHVAVRAGNKFNKPRALTVPEIEEMVKWCASCPTPSSS